MRNDILIPTIALVLGGTAGFLVSKILLEKKYAALAEEQIQTEVASVKERLDDKCSKCQFKKTRVETSIQASKILENTEQTVHSINTVSSLGARSNGYAEQKRAYNLGGSLVRDQARHEPSDYDHKNDEPDEDLRDGEIMRLEETGDQEPYLISDIEFSEGCNHYDKLTCYYYSEDDTMTDEHEQLMFEDDREKTLGVENVIDGFNVANPKTIWIRNERLGTDYEVIFIKGAYQDIVGGMRGMSPREQQEARMRRKDIRRRDE